MCRMRSFRRLPLEGAAPCTPKNAGIPLVVPAAPLPPPPLGGVPPHLLEEAAIPVLLVLALQLAPHDHEDEADQPPPAPGTPDRKDM